MELYDAMFSRRSCRQYDSTPLSQAEVDKIASAADKFPRLYSGVEVEGVVAGADQVKGLGRVEAPHYMLVYGTGQPGEAEAAGFLYQLWGLWMTTQGYGTVWLGIVNPAKREDGKKGLITIGFGRPAQPIHRAVAEFNRKPLSEISTGQDARLEAACLAPSGTNSQPWYFIADAATHDLYVYKKKGSVNKLFYSFPDLDMGIALAHLYVAGQQLGMPFCFSTEEQGAPEPPKGYDWMGVVKA